MVYFNLEKIKDKQNCFEIRNNMIRFYPINDGMPTCPIKFYKENKLIIDNTKSYSQITNLDDILIQLTDLMNYGFDNNIIINPYHLMLELTDKIDINYNGKANLVMMENTILNSELKEEEIEDARNYFINDYLDHFIGWNFGVSVNRNEILKEKLENLNNKIIDMGIRKYAGPGIEVYGTVNNVYDNLQHYKFKTGNEKVKKIS